MKYTGDQKQEMILIFDTLMIDRINNEFNIESEDYTLGVKRYGLEQDDDVQNHMTMIEEPALGLNDDI